MALAGFYHNFRGKHCECARYSAASIFVIILAASGFCTNVSFDSLRSGKNIRLSGFAALQEGQFVKAHFDSITGSGGGPSNAYTPHTYRPYPFPQWVHRFYGRLQLDAYFKERFHVIISPEIRMWTNTIPGTANDKFSDRQKYPFRQYSTPFIADMEGIYSFGDTGRPFFQIAAGIFPFKYDSEASNLGEYLFRSGCYPPSLTTDFDRPYATLTGIRIGSTVFEHLRQDLLLTTETQIQPLYDWSVSYLVNYDLPSFFAIGAGVSFNRLFPISDSLTTPKTLTSSYLSDTTFPGKLNYYTFSGTKLMGRLSIDPKGLLPQNVAAVFGINDLKIFFETALLGLDTFPDSVYAYYDLPGNDSTIVLNPRGNYYHKLSERNPVMFGMNIPAFKILDILSVQAEWFGWRFPNTIYSLTPGNNTVVPTPEITSGYGKDNWKWSVYAKKTVANSVSIICQFANDHTRPDIYERLFDAYIDNNGVFTSNKDWGWWLKIQYNFSTTHR